MSDQICSRCEIEAPFNFIQPMFIGGSGYHLVCPECALAITNEIHGSNFTGFQGEMAQEILEQFREWKEENANP